MERELKQVVTKLQSTEPNGELVAVSKPAPGKSSPSLRAVSVQRQLGAYYTCPDAAVHMAKWVLGDGARRVLEPSFGAGVFVNAVQATAVTRGRDVEIFGAELADDAFQSAVYAGLIEPGRAHFGDFLAWSPPVMDAVIGNPPYVRMRHLPAEQGAVALRVTVDELGAPMETSGSVWMPFVLHAARLLRVGGRMALVLPFDFTYVRYARPLWRRLAATFGSLRIARVHERLFPDILQDVVILFAGDRGGKTESVTFQAFDTVPEFLAERPTFASRISVSAVVTGERAFMRALLPAELTDELGGRLLRTTAPVRETCTFNIGYVCGHKSFFHPDVATQRKYGLLDDSLTPSITSSRQMKAVGLRTAGSPRLEADRLFMPSGAVPLRSGEQEYVKHGEALGVHERYKCRVRKPWFVVPGVRTPDLILSVFSERPVLAINDGKFAATNSLLCGFLKGGSAEAFAAAWYSSLTLLGCESEVHALGGGVMVLVPKETGNIRVPTIREVPVGHLEQLSGLLARGDVQGAYDLGDDMILVRNMRIPNATVDLIRRGVSTLAHWRTSSRGGLTAVSEVDGYE